MFKSVNVITLTCTLKCYNYIFCYITLHNVTHFFISIFTMLVASNKQFLNLKLLVGFLGQAPKS